jgi:hypothetical protein
MIKLVLHEHARLRILTLLASRERARALYRAPRTGLGMTAVTFSVQIKTLEAARLRRYREVLR